ncbi:uncharacterized protein LOC120355056 isoform X5 [Nilaparvata lugens]|uniref:uncharacterized protein LOC120355056 isoform X5 n=1 Tax=Nilaparvata lugens TaxID=108931 RepID=UPI00193DD8CD|nr:uncharacterized protein LOC120355056 isoform X5 [Nilaparvata lugens]
MPETRSNSALQAVMAERRDVIKHLRWNARKLNFEAPLSEDAYYELKLLQTDVQDLKDRYIEIKDKLESLDSDNFNDEEHFATLDEFLSVTAIINKHIHNFEKAHGQTDANIAPAPVAQPAPTNSNFRLPEIPLPTFDGNFDKWLDFKAGFSSIIVNNDSVEPSIKYQYLKQALSGEALNRIANSPPGDFKLAWSLLTQRYNSVILIADSHISAIMNPPSLNSKSAQSWRTFIDHQKLNITALESLELDIEVKDLLFMHLIVSRFDANTLRDWERSNSVKDKTSLDNLWTFMEQQHKVSQYVSFGLGSHAQSAQRLVNNQSGNGKPSHNSINNNSRPSTSSTFVKYSGCLFCNDTNHNVFRCNTFLNMAPTARLNAVQQKNLCRNCLRPFSKDHQCFGACRDCGKAHHSLLHFNNSKSSPTVGKNTSSNNAHTRKPNRQQASKSSSNCCCSESKQSDIPSPAVFTPSLTRPVSQASSISVSDTSSVTTVVTPTSSTSSQAISNSNCAHSNSPSLLQRVNIMPTAQLHILSKNNQVISCRALLDTGSDACFISKALASQLDLDSVYSNNTIHTVSGTSSAPVCTAAVLIHSPDRTWSKEVSCILTEKITPSIPPFGLNLQNFNIPPNVKLADPEFHVSKGVDLLLSVAIYSSIQACGQIQLADECTLQNTKLGWVVWGAITPNILNSCEQPVSSNCVSTHDISRQLEKFWKIEEVLPKDSVTKEQHQIEKHYLDNVQRGQDGRFSVALPKKDNATTFVGANNELKELCNFFANERSQSEIQNFATLFNISWRFIPPRAPHFGGLWENAIKNFKRIFKTISFNKILDYEDATTFSAQVEAILNSRPLIPLSEDPEDLQYISPGHFLIGRPITALPFPLPETTHIDHRSRWKNLALATKELWKKWSTEYLVTLQTKAKWTEESENLKVDTIVLLKDPGTVPSTWRLARIVELHPGKDQKVRVVTVLTETGLFKRAISSIAPLPQEEELD